MSKLMKLSKNISNRKFIILNAHIKNKKSQINNLMLNFMTVGRKRRKN
jgi:hypothetical protein